MLTQDVSQFWDELVSCQGDTPQLLQLIAARVADVVGEASALTVVSRDGTKLEPAAIYHDNPDVVDAMRTVLGTTPHDIGTGLAGIAAARREPVVVSNLTAADKRALIAPAWHPFLARYPVRSIMVVPLVAYGDLVGTLGAFRIESEAPYTDADLNVLEALGERAALALAESHRAHRSLNAAELHAIFENSLDGIMFTMPDGQILAANPAACEILRMSEDEICRRGRSGLLPADDPRVKHAVAQRAISGRVQAEVPMVRGGGQMFTADISSTVFPTSDGELRACVIFRDASEQVEWRKRLERQSRQFERLSEEDDLTRLLNRRGLAISAKRTLAFADRDLAPVQVVYCDIDDLKTINDRLGHHVGDRVIAKFADAVRTSIREIDSAARIGGDEFVLLLYGATERETQLVLDRIAETFANSEARVAVSFSAGRAGREPGDGRSLDELLDRADKEMYKQKLLHRMQRSAG